MLCLVWHDAGGKSDEDEKPAKHCLCAGGGAYQTLLKRVAAPGYPSRPDIALHAVTIQIPLEASLSVLLLSCVALDSSKALHGIVI